MALSTRSWISVFAVAGGALLAACANGAPADEGAGPYGTGGPTVDSDDAGTVGPGDDASLVHQQDSGTSGSGDDGGNDDDGGNGGHDDGGSGGNDSGSGGNDDGGKDGSVVVDAGTDSGMVLIPDSGNGTDASVGVCTAGSASGFMSSYHAPALNGECAHKSDIDAFYTACLDDTLSSTADCNANKVANASCYNCIVSNSTDSTWGPLVVWPNGGGVEINQGGCVADESSSTTSTNCAKAIEAQQECEHLACDPTCNNATQASYDACVTAADNGGCATYYNKANSQCANVPSSTSPCFPSGDFEAQFKATAQVFCYF